MDGMESFLLLFEIKFWKYTELPHFKRKAARTRLNTILKGLNIILDDFEPYGSKTIL